jgi:hypothetical protein
MGKGTIKPEWYSQERKQHLLLEFIMNLKRFLSHNTRACQTKFKGLENYRYFKTIFFSRFPDYDTLYIVHVITS